MTRQLSDKHFRDRDAKGTRFSDMSFRNCIFESCSVAVGAHARDRPTIRNVQLRNCTALGCAIGAVIAEDVLVEGLRTTGRVPLFIRGAAFRHVVLRGHIGGLTITGDARRPSVKGIDDVKLKREIDEANERYYRSVDWALDISEAECEDLDMRGGIPASLIRRDPRTQIVVTRERALEGRWREVDLSGTWWPETLNMFINDNYLDSGYASKVLVAPRRHPNYVRLLEALERLRDAGVAETD